MSYSYFARVYDLLTENVEYSRRADYICSLLSENGINGGLLLDVACGTGSLSVEMSKRGFDVTGVDISREMLCEAQNKMYESGENILFLCQDMRYLDLFGTVDCAVCTLDSLNHLTSEEDLLKAFKSVSLFLEDGGIFIFDMNTPYKHREILADNSFVYELDDLFCVWRNSLCDDGVIVEINLDFFEKSEGEDYKRYSESFSEKAYGSDIVNNLLKQADLTLVSQYKELSFNAPDVETQRTVFVARRNKR